MATKSRRAISSDDILLRSPPQSLEAEQSVLGSILLQNEVLEYATEIIDARDFYRETHREMFRAMIDLAERKQPIDAITLCEVLRTKGTLDAVGGPAYIAEVASIVPTATNIAHYAEIVRDKSLLRELASVATDVASDAYDATYSTGALLGEAESKLGKVFARAWGEAREESERDSIFEAEQDLLNGRNDSIIKTGFEGIDASAWLMPGDLITLAGATSSGKTTLAANIMLNVIRAGHGAIFFSYEMAKRQLNHRMICSMAQVAGDRGQWGSYSDAEKERIEFSAAELREMPLEIIWARNQRPAHIKNALRRTRREFSKPVKLVCVDFLQCMQADKPHRTREEDYDDIMRILKDLAGEWQCVVMVLSAFNRESAKRGNAVPPRLSELKGSASIEYYSDGVWFLWAPVPANERDIELLVAKNRNGTKDRIALAHFPQYLRFEPR